MKYILSLLFTLCVFILSAQDTTAVSSEVKQEFLVKRLTEELNLTGEQQTSVRVIIRERSEQINQAKNPGNGNVPQLTAINGQAKQALKAVLTEEQYNLFVQLRKELKEQRDAYYAGKGENYETDDEELEF